MAIRWLIQSLWLALVFYWLISARRVKPAKHVEGRVWSLARTAVTVFVFVLIFSPWGRIGWLGHRFAPRSTAMAVAGAIITAIGLGLAAWARFVLGRNWSAAVSLKESHELIRTGPYARIRHPIYSGIILGLLGTALAVGEWRALVAMAVLSLSYLLIKARKEERLLAREFGPAFQEYRSHTGMFLPWPR